MVPSIGKMSFQFHHSLHTGGLDYPAPPSYPAGRRGSAGEVVGQVRPGDWPCRARLAHVAGGRGRGVKTKLLFLQLVKITKQTLCV
jgi:hypothetical protein